MSRKANAERLKRLAKEWKTGVKKEEPEVVEAPVAIEVEIEATEAPAEVVEMEEVAEEVMEEIAVEESKPKKKSRKKKEEE